MTPDDVFAIGGEDRRGRGHDEAVLVAPAEQRRRGAHLRGALDEILRGRSRSACETLRGIAPPSRNTRYMRGRNPPHARVVAGQGRRIEP
jgi:hypothetical protein